MGKKYGWLSKCGGKLFPTECKENRSFFKRCPAQVFGKVPDGEVFVFVLFYYMKHQNLSYFVFLVSLFPGNKATSGNSKAAGFLNRSRRIRKEINLDTKTFLFQIPNTKKGQKLQSSLIGSSLF